ncbi:MAG: dihydrofolate reductase family protein [Acidobacteriota bacterium]
MRKIVASLALSADGYIARADGDVAWLDRPRTAGDYGMADFYRSIDTVLLGRKTWVTGVKLGRSFFPGKKNYVFSRSAKQPKDAEVELVSEDVAGFARRLKKQSGKDIWLVGGGSLIASFLDAGQIDELILHVVPVFIGEGIPLIEPARREVPLELLSSYAYADGVTRLHYAIVERSGRRSRGAATSRRRRAAPIARRRSGL